MNSSIKNIILQFDDKQISKERQAVLAPFKAYIAEKASKKEDIRLNFICTHNSRRSHLSQVWAQTMAFYFGVKQVFCYSGGTEATAMFPKIKETLQNQGFEIQQLSLQDNPVYTIKYAVNEAAVICFSKTYNDAFNPQSAFAAILTCDHADENCPVVIGAEARFAVQYEDPKAFDGTEIQNEKYAERSLEIAQEMWWVFGGI